ncbi:GNAT family N-acetyltransferase [Cellulophaga fucicola]|uniref:Acetyltransferase (GNAT) domain-containing protein n=1 Tax=Cellulophaga fucicola TaxID=76595 RepID=A0A1K1M046_9FLAO|nr:GNAT family N-acetyltransferase [Cellulophaga fucicola]SFW16481.1 Acetyltransferase (GNAT) domain-containing protein [Cellulophaga fucicola]
MMKIIGNKKEWDALLDKVAGYDFYHTYDYHINCAHDDEEIALISYTTKDTIIAFPVLIRPIKNSSFFDVTSVYGYGGPLSKNITPDTNLTPFYNKLRIYFQQKNIICAYSSLNPYIDNQKRILSGLGKIENISKIVNLNLKQTLEEQESNFSKTTKRYINRNKKLFYSRIGKTKEDVAIFIDMYYKTMSRLQANENYFFKEDYFYDILKSNQYNAEIVFAVAKDTNTIASAALIIKTDKTIIQYHLSGTLEEYKHLSPIRFILNEVRVQGTLEGYSYFNLGGGFGGNHDSLFDFKASFSNDYKKFKVWKYILNTEEYNTLSSQNKNLTPLLKTSFFPLYRYNK